MAQLVVSGDAERDLRAIAAYTSQRWGRDQAIAYLRSFDPVLDRIAGEPARGTMVPLADGSRRWRTKHRHHFIFYRHDDDTVLVERILHERMDLLAHLR